MTKNFMEGRQSAKLRYYQRFIPKDNSRKLKKKKNHLTQECQKYYGIN